MTGDFAAKAGRVLDLYQRIHNRRVLCDDAYVISADEKICIQACCRCHPSLPPAAVRAMRVEHAYDRGSALAYLAAWDVRHARIFGRCESTIGIVPSRTRRLGVCTGWWATAAATATSSPPKPFERKFTRSDLDQLLKHLADKPDLAPAA